MRRSGREVQQLMAGDAGCWAVQTQPNLLANKMTPELDGLIVRLPESQY